MLGRCYTLGRLLMSRGWLVGLALVALTIGLGTNGFYATETWDNGDAVTLLDALYLAISLLAIQTGDVSTAGVTSLEWARWLGLLFWASAITTVLVRLFRDSVHGLLVKILARGHIIVAGLGPHGGRLVEALRKKGLSVVVIEPDRNHPAADECGRSGAVVLFGEPEDPRMLRAANLPLASTLLALLLDEAACVRVATAAFDVLHKQKATSQTRPVRCVLRVIEPGLLDVVRSHKIKTDPGDRIELEILNSHEIAATTMVREATANSERGEVKKALILGLGTHHRLGEMVVLRAVKDYLIANRGEVREKLKVDVFDRQARQWLTSFCSRHPFVDDVCTIKAHTCWARKVGSREFERDYDAAFVCIGDEGPATAQSVMLRRDVLTGTQPIMVRVRLSYAGYGELVGHADSGWGDHIHAVGLEDSLFDPETALRPEIEMRAKTIHHNYRQHKRQEYLAEPDPAKRLKIQKESANRPWHRLGPEDRDQNRQLAAQYDEYLAMVIPGSKTTRYRRKFAPFQGGDLASKCVIPKEELDALAEVEHGRWLALKLEQGFTLGDDRSNKQNPFLMEWAQLSDAQKAFASQFAWDMPRVLALADYVVERVKP